MTPEKMFESLLGLGESWEVIGTEYLDDESKILLMVRETAKLWELEKCS